MLHFPKGWQLPQNSTIVGTKSYSNLLFQAGVIGKIEDTAVSYAEDGYGKLISSPMSFLLAGSYSSIGASVLYRNSRGYYWSKSPSSTTFIYNFYFTGITVYPRNASTKPSGFTVRCVAL